MLLFLNVGLHSLRKRVDGIRIMLRKDNVGRFGSGSSLHDGFVEGDQVPRASFSGRIALSRAGRHLRQVGSQGEGSSDQSAADVSTVREMFGSAAPLRYLRFFLRNAEAEGEAAEDMLHSLTLLGREMSELIHSLQLHFTDCPDVPAALSRTVGNQTTVNDVEVWIRTHLIPLAESRLHALEIVIDPIVGLLPTNVLYGLIVEHLRRRVTDRGSRSRLRLNVHAEKCGVRVEISEFGATVPPVPILDEATRMLWARVVHMLQGTIAWRQLRPARNTHSPEGIGNVIQITYPISLASQFEPASTALRTLQNGRDAA